MIFIVYRVMSTLNSIKIFQKHTILLLSIFLIGVIVAGIYINATLNADINSHTVTPLPSNKVFQNS